MRRGLNGYDVPTDGQGDYRFARRAVSASSTDGSVVAYFDGLEDRLIEHINGSDFVLGCVAWLTNERILKALATREASIIVQKEDFLRPDIRSRKGWAGRLRKQYEAIPFKLERIHMRNALISNLSVGCQGIVESVRCVGNHNSKREPAFPRSHHKFVVFGKYRPGQRDVPMYDDHPGFDLLSVWTGSFNFSKSGTESFENAVILTDPTIVQAYYAEYAHILSLSEPLDWTSRWVEPEWRIGT